MPPSFEETKNPQGLKTLWVFCCPNMEHISLIIVIFVTNPIPPYTIYSNGGKLKLIIFGG
jgi:hypothetical protein